MLQQELIETITRAFEHEPYPGDSNIVYDNSGFHLECIEIRDAFAGHLWQEVPDRVLQAEQTALSFMSSKGFKYYLPTFMCLQLRDESVLGDGVEMVVSMLKLPAEIDVAVLAHQIQQSGVADKLPDIDLNQVLQNQLVQTNAGINHFIARAAEFTKAQGQAIYHFLAYLRDKPGDDFMNQHAALAIQRYWFLFA